MSNHPDAVIIAAIPLEVTVMMVEADDFRWTSATSYNHFSRLIWIKDIPPR
jgi:hypothetical protein